MPNEELVEKLFSVRDVLGSVGDKLHKCSTLAEVEYRNWEALRPMLVGGLAEIEDAYIRFKGVIENDLLPGSTFEPLGYIRNACYIDSIVSRSLVGNLSHVSLMLRSVDRTIGTCLTLLEVDYQDWPDMEQTLNESFKVDHPLSGGLGRIEQAYVTFKVTIEKTLLPGTIVNPPSFIS